MKVGGRTSTSALKEILLREGGTRWKKASLLRMKQLCVRMARLGNQNTKDQSRGVTINKGEKLERRQVHNHTGVEPFKRDEDLRKWK